MSEEIISTRRSAMIECTATEKHPTIKAGNKFLVHPKVAEKCEKHGWILEKVSKKAEKKAEK